MILRNEIGYRIRYKQLWLANIDTAHAISSCRRIS